ncbi:hypothetical protein ABZ604_32885 [Streptomyces sp. NPDC012473]|uniref:hypothetical protein n=1 Tax=Streptomyces sp. NPDC012473 TaxID=3156676 RepID=UPI003406303C
MPQQLAHRQITKEFASALLSTGSVATSLAIGVTTTQAAWTLTPAPWFGDLRIIAAGALCLAVAAGTESLLEIILVPLRRSLWPTSTTTPVTAVTPTPPVAETQEEGLAQITAATEADSAHRAAIASWTLDHGALFNSEDRWRGYATGEATFYIAPGVVLHYRLAGGHLSEPEFTLLTGNADDPVDVVTVRDVLQYLINQRKAAAHARVALAKEVPEAVDGLTASMRSDAAADEPAF